MFVDTMKQAKRLVKIVIGFTLLLLGVIMWLTPGPGWAAVIGGLAILAAEFVWARRLLNRIKQTGVRMRDAVWTPSPKVPQTPPGPPPPVQPPPQQQ